MAQGRPGPEVVPQVVVGRAVTREGIPVRWVAEVAVGDTWRNIRNELDRMHLVTLATTEGRVSQRTELTPGQRSILGALELPEPPRFCDFTPAWD